MSHPGMHRRTLMVVGHRGAMGYRPENTLPSFQHALDLGADWVEFDVHLSRDGQPVVIHDETVDRTTNGHGLVRDHTLSELKKLDAGAWFGPDYAGAQIPSLDEVLEWAQRNTVGVDIEIKNAPLFYEGIEHKVVAALRAADMVDHALVSSFDHRAVKRVGELEPRVKLGVLYAARPADGGVALARAATAQVVLPQEGYVRAEDVAEAHQAGLQVVPWATSDRARVRELLGMGVDGLCTNHPDVLVPEVVR